MKRDYDIEAMRREDLKNSLQILRNGIRAHRASYISGDDKCWKDNEVLYQLLPEGYTPPERDSLVEISNCIQYLRSCYDPRCTYVSPQRRIEELERELSTSRLVILALREAKDASL